MCDNPPSTVAVVEDRKKKDNFTKLVMQEVGRTFGDPVQGIADLKDAARAVDDMEGCESKKAGWKAFFLG